MLSVICRQTRIILDLQNEGKNNIQLGKGI